MDAAALDHIHVFEPGDMAHPPLLLLHGTGGDERDLLELGKAVAPGFSLLSPRGRVLENGMPRFFRRLAEGVFDHEDLIARTDALADFVNKAREVYGLAAPVALGFSNGANIAAAMLYRRPDTLAGAALLRAMVPFEQAPLADLAGKPVLILSGSADPILPAENAATLARTLQAHGASVSHEILPGGHGLTQADLRLTTQWFTQLW